MRVDDGLDVGPRGAERLDGVEERLDHGAIEGRVPLPRSGVTNYQVSTYLTIDRPGQYGRGPEAPRGTLKGPYF